MQSLTERVWAERFAELRPFILEEWPDVDRQELDVVAGDWDALVALLHRRSGLSSGDVIRRLRALDVDELGLGGRAPEAEEAPEVAARASVDLLRLGKGFADDERGPIVERLRKLDRRLKRFPADGTELELSIKDRDTTSQSVTLECWLPNFPRVVATSNLPDLRDALMDIREDLWRQIDDAVTRRTDAAR
jgi:hypothetical protein